VAVITQTLAKQLATRTVFPQGHVIGICYTKIFGPKMKSTPEGHPIQISSGPFDNTVETALSAIKRAAQKWHGIVQSVDSDWVLDLEEDVIQPAHGPRIGYSKLYYFTYRVEQPLWQHKGLTPTSVINHFLTAHYITKKHLTRTAVDQSLATTLVPALTTTI
jgi:hypothetical protein